MRDCTMVVTGASGGIGAAAARSLSDLGAAVVVAGRSAAKTSAVAANCARIGTTPTSRISIRFASSPRS